MTKEEYIKLYQKAIEGNCSTAELELLRQYGDDFKWIETNEVDPLQRDRVFASLMKSIEGRERKRAFTLWKKVGVAAAILIVCTLSLIYFKGKHSAIEAGSQVVQKTRIQPGSNKAILTLGDGRTIVLDNAASGKLASESGTTILKTKDGEIAYDVDATQKDHISFNIISIPRGGQYNLILPDGTKVWLNAASTLRFPTRFAGDIRKVELDGEAYFEVAKNKQAPFFVNARDMKVKVLGTHFNVMAYKDEPQIVTTLLEGKVSLSSATKNVLLAPGQQGLYSANGFQVKKADLSEAMAWKNGYFIFNGESLSAIMRKISRWYDVDIDDRTQNGNLTYTGSVSRFENIAEVLKVLSLTETVKFNIKERRVTVTN